MLSNTRNNVVSPFFDFLLLGGASLIIFPLVMYLLPVERLHALRVIPFFIAALFYIDYLANFPHFAYSYQLMYQDFVRKITGGIDAPLRIHYIVAGIIVPAGMIAFFIFVCLQNSTVAIKHAVNVMLLTAGWHYAKQGFGILIVTSVYSKKPKANQ